jgi:hypothetical protein
MGNIVATWGRESAKSGGCEPIQTWGLASHGRSASLDAGDHPRDEEESYRSGIYRGEYASRRLTLKWSHDRGRRRAITREARSSHVCNAFAVEKGDGEADVSIKFVYIWEYNYCLW